MPAQAAGEPAQDVAELWRWPGGRSPRPPPRARARQEAGAGGSQIRGGGGPEAGGPAAAARVAGGVASAGEGRRLGRPAAWHRRGRGGGGVAGAARR